MAKWEDSKADRKIDAKGMKKTGMSAAQWEKSPQDKKADAKGMKAMAKGKKR